MVLEEVTRSRTLNRRPWGNSLLDAGVLQMKTRLTFCYSSASNDMGLSDMLINMCSMQVCGNLTLR
jgi:hypothetical protein